tara:strand:+ start:300 stop:698 length:399 start_codon:yes stop_codon:yes gene_type:complete
LRTALWFSVLGTPDNDLFLPYVAQSPSLSKRIKFENRKDVNEEIQRILSEKNIYKFGIGKSLFFQMPFFCNPTEYISNWCWEMIEDYHLVKEYNIPLASKLDDLNVWQSDCFLALESELQSIKHYKSKQNGK